ncbi:hypothetical protein [Phormidesmis sp. 146-33]
MKHPVKLSQGFECEIDSADWILCELVWDGLEISFQSDREDETISGVTIGQGKFKTLSIF